MFWIFQALVVLVHDMGQNWELVCDAINSIVQFKVLFFSDVFFFLLCNMLLLYLLHVQCELFLFTIPMFYIFSGCHPLCNFISVCSSQVTIFILTLTIVSCNIICYHNNSGHYFIFSTKLNLGLLHAFLLCSLYIGNLKNARSDTRFLWIEVLVMALTVQRTPVHLSTTIAHCRAFQRHVPPLPCFVGTFYFLACMWGATHTYVALSLSYSSWILSLKSMLLWSTPLQSQRLIWQMCITYPWAS